MKKIVFPHYETGHCRSLPFFLAAEEWVARTLAPQEWIFTWVVAPTVICGRHQDIANEVDLDFCRSRGIDVVRRRSGGGCVYADRGNIMISYVCAMQGRSVDKVFGDYARALAGQLRAMGFDAKTTGRNDVTIDGRKISGGAFYRIGDRAISHSTMLYDTDPENMLRAITPSRAKLAAKGVRSVASRITTAREHNPALSFDDFHRGLTAGLCDGEYRLSAADLTQIEELEKRYRLPSWLRFEASADKADARSASRHFAGVGNVKVELNVDDAGFITALCLSGDMMGYTDAHKLVAPLVGLRAERAEIVAAIDTQALDALAPGLPPQTLAELIAEAALINNV